MSSADIGFTRYKARSTVENTCRNLRRPDLQDALSARLEGARSVIVAGAGPSLDEFTADDLEGSFVIAVNTAVKGLPREPDVIVCRESLDLADQIEGTDALVCLDISCHPNTVAAATNAAFFVPAYPRTSDLAAWLGLPTIAAGPAALTAAVRLAQCWGAQKISLIGADLSFAPSGSAYAPKSSRGGLTWRMVSPGVVTVEGDAQDIERCERSGQKPPPRTLRVEEFPSWDWGSVVYSQPAWADQRLWLSKFADEHPHVERANCTLAGVGIPGWGNDALCYPEGETRLNLQARRVSTATARNNLFDEAAEYERFCRDFPSGAGSPALGCPLADAWAAQDLMDMTSRTPLKIKYAALARGAAAVQRLLIGK